ncbi:hypothetical protein B0H13DRAFT_2677593 [Mycena leptocephala]|nr:hypothetical protein B0H13DRAFT_2677593 [Mycena leptocephala]
MACGKEEGEEREAGAGPWPCSSTFSWHRGPEASGSARSDSFIYAPLVLPLPLPVAAAQLTRIRRLHGAHAFVLSCDLPFILPLPGSGALRMRACAHSYPPEYLVPLCVSAGLAHWSVPRAVRAPTALRTRREHSVAAPRATSRIRGWAPPGLYDKRGSAHTRDCPARCDYEVREPERGYWDPGTAVLCAAHAHRAEETLDESTVSPPTPAPDGASEDRRCTTRGVNEGAERAHPRDWPACHGYEVWELERDGEECICALPRALGSLRRLCSRSASYDRIMMTGIEIGIGIANRRIDGADDGYARAWTGGDGEKERELERGKGKRWRAEHDKREEGMPGLFLLSKWRGRDVVGGDVRGMGLER